MTPIVGSVWTRKGGDPEHAWMVTRLRWVRGRTFAVLAPTWETHLGEVEWPVVADRRRASFATAWERVVDTAAG